MQAKEYQGWDEWATKFKPKDNHLVPSNGKMYETYGAEYEYIKSMHPNFIWTWVQGDFCDLLVAGVAYVNRLGYYVTENPWDNEWDSVLLSVQEECECYSEDDDVMETRDLEYGDPDCQKCEGSGYVTNYV